MPFFVKIKPCFVTMLWALVVAGAIMLSLPQYAHAGRVPSCGDIDKGLIKDIYAAARRVDYVVDVKGTMNLFCSFAENLEQLEEDLPREVRNKQFKRSRRAIIKDAESDLSILKAQLIVLRTWNSYNPHDTTDKVLRRSRMKKAKKKVLSSFAVMGQHAARIQVFMDKYKGEQEKKD